ncbi:hypothetical protein ERICI_03808 [Paenibacillus larvae subsp. larvae]|uniref:Uncharacterized protein n=1 Tax=Paenibacillus larvae subsp. larvae TaxID=147375 RepID=A0A6C0QMY1_9BACL|nr:hypothetical protein ERICI_03808 [Paenibacillus larvae subsp. larvae]AVG13774.1 hypothetical protein ERICII_03471 [Paenibacillus larvae subsp. larvae DSM 25430]ETK29855.1 hypothetical protein ERIC1_1c34140 [Paenibacillus larvae subsp. larvae DSM 25719]QHZ50072.1 hypothetical protein ERICV_00895 [Paenibacillus larvae subsp. larvae]
MILYGLIFLVLFSVHLLLKEVINFKKGKPMNYLILFLSFTSLITSIAALFLMLMGIDE